MHCFIGWQFTVSVIVLVCGFFLVESSVLAQTRGLHNSTKRFTAPGKMSPDDWTSPLEMKRSWQASIVRIPVGRGHSKRVRVSSLERVKSTSKKYPTIIYMHGCAGVWSGTLRRVTFLANNGYLVIAPASFARKKYPRSCNTKTHKGGLYRPTLRMRQMDAGYAIETAKKLPMVDDNRVVLMGLSQGGITTATFIAKNPNQRVRLRVIEGWTCHAGWFDYKGLWVPKDVPVLSLVGARDPWFQKRWLKGDCGKFMTKGNGSKSIVYRKGKLAYRHELLEYSRPRRAVLEFLRQHLK